MSASADPLCCVGSRSAVGRCNGEPRCASQLSLLGVRAACGGLRRALGAWRRRGDADTWRFFFRSSCELGPRESVSLHTIYHLSWRRDTEEYDEQTLTRGTEPRPTRSPQRARASRRVCGGETRGREPPREDTRLSAKHTVKSGPECQWFSPSSMRQSGMAAVRRGATKNRRRDGSSAAWIW